MTWSEFLIIIVITLYPLCVLVTQLCLTLCHPMECSPPGPSVHGLLQARVMEWVAIPFSRGSSLIQGLNLGLPHYRQIFYHQSHLGFPLLPCILICSFEQERKVRGTFNAQEIIETT